MPRAYPSWVPLTRDQITAVIEEALTEGEVADAAITTALYPQGAPAVWALWHEDAQAIYFEAVEYHSERRKSFLVEPVLVQPDTPRPARRRHRITPEDGWRVVEESSRAEPEHVRLTWPDIAARLGTERRAAEHLMKARLGFRFGGKVGSRTVERGPCVECGKLHPAEDFRGGNRGPCCASEQAA
jgi:hypothetical protein